MTNPRWTEWEELVWRGVLIVLLRALAYFVRDLAMLRTSDAEKITWAWAENHTRQAEQIQLLKAICVQTALIYDIARGVCEPTAIAEPKKLELPTLKGGPYRK